ncbi:MAG: iron-containing redox enzyme family protein [Euryarchaeota archaeon]|nr:iron-containing redox enzyme family protein [Euryarchaeota archaeon]MDE1837118.1 iron-containing redox enzyme family protein [Euryarchaeota archaeon]MDE1879670.1 iron-containing redox enzyme family protein [Euryarchaeota archaeon]MDE2045196.1 iron-containing redox enzyme family protein [Thermoplasmata archaeon]
MSGSPWDLSPKEFCEELARYKLAHHPFRTHPFFREWEEGKLPLDHIRAWAPQFYAWLCVIPRAYALRFAQLPWDDAHAKYRDMLLEHLTEEAGYPSEQHRPHPELFLNFCKGIGLSREKVQSTPWLPGTYLAVDDFLYVNHYEPFYVSAAGSSEPPNVELCERLLPTLRNVYKVPEANLEYYVMHGELDKEHSQLVNSIVADFAGEGPQTRRRMWEAMLRGIGVHQALVDGVLWSLRAIPPRSLKANMIPPATLSRTR